MSDVSKYNEAVTGDHLVIINRVFDEFLRALPMASAKVWHGAPLWFIDDTPIAGYQNHKSGVTVLFWSGTDFSEPGLLSIGKHRAAGITYTDIETVNIEDLRRYLRLSTEIIWDYKAVRPRK